MTPPGPLTKSDFVTWKTSNERRWMKYVINHCCLCISTAPPGQLWVEISHFENQSALCIFFNQSIAIKTFIKRSERKITSIPINQVRISEIVPLIDSICWPFTWIKGIFLELITPHFTLSLPSYIYRPIISSSTLYHASLSQYSVKISRKSTISLITPLTCFAEHSSHPS